MASSNPFVHANVGFGLEDFLDRRQPDDLVADVSPLTGSFGRLGRAALGWGRRLERGFGWCGCGGGCGGRSGRTCNRLSGLSVGRLRVRLWDYRFLSIHYAFFRALAWSCGSRRWKGSIRDVMSTQLASQRQTQKNNKSASLSDLYSSLKNHHKLTIFPICTTTAYKRYIHRSPSFTCPFTLRPRFDDLA